MMALLKDGATRRRCEKCLFVLITGGVAQFLKEPKT